MSFTPPNYLRAPATFLIPVRSPLLSVGTVSSVLHLPSDRILKLIDSGALAFAFDISGEKSTKITAKISAQSLLDYVRHEKNQTDLTTDQFLQSILPSYPLISATAVSRILSCNADHVGILVAEKTLPEATPRKFKKQSPKISCESVFHFLKRRRIL